MLQIGHCPSLPVQGSSKDYLTINRKSPTSHSLNSKPISKNCNKHPDFDRLNRNTEDPFNMKKPPDKKQKKLNIEFGDYYPRSSESSLADDSAKSPQFCSVGDNRRNDSSNSNQSGYESSVSSTNTDLSLTANNRKQSNTSWSQEVLHNIPETEKQNDNDPSESNDEVFNDNSPTHSPLEENSFENSFSNATAIPNESLPLSVLKLSPINNNVDRDGYTSISHLLSSLSNSAQREKRLSSSSSYGRKSVSFSLEVKSDDDNLDENEAPSYSQYNYDHDFDEENNQEDDDYFDDDESGTDEADEEFDELSPLGSESVGSDNKLLLRPEFMSMKPTYV